MAHDHDHGARANRARVFWALILTAVFMVAEFFGGLWWAG